MRDYFANNKMLYFIFFTFIITKLISVRLDSTLFKNTSQLLYRCMDTSLQVLVHLSGYRFIGSCTPIRLLVCQRRINGESRGRAPTFCGEKNCSLFRESLKHVWIGPLIGSQWAPFMKFLYPPLYVLIRIHQFIISRFKDTNIL